MSPHKSPGTSSVTQTGQRSSTGPVGVSMVARSQGVGDSSTSTCTPRWVSSSAAGPGSGSPAASPTRRPASGLSLVGLSSPSHEIRNGWAPPIRDPTNASRHVSVRPSGRARGHLERIGDVGHAGVAQRRHRGVQVVAPDGERHQPRAGLEAIGHERGSDAWLGGVRRDHLEVARRPERGQGVVRAGAGVHATEHRRHAGQLGHPPVALVQRQRGQHEVIDPGPHAGDRTLASVLDDDAVNAQRSARACSRSSTDIGPTCSVATLPSASTTMRHRQDGGAEGLGELAAIVEVLVERDAQLGQEVAGLAWRPRRCRHRRSARPDAPC